MRAFFALPLLLAACSGESSGNNTQPPAPRPTGPAPKTPVTDVSPEPGNSASWMGTRDDAGDPKTAPYGNLLDQPLVNGAAQ